MRIECQLTFELYCVLAQVLGKQPIVENLVLILDCCILILETWFLRDSANQNGLYLVSSNLPSTLNTRLL